MNLLGVHVYICESFTRPGCAAVGVDFMGNLQMVSSTIGFRFEDRRSDIALHPASLGDIAAIIDEATVTRSASVLDFALETVVLSYHSALFFKEPIVVSDPLSISCSVWMKTVAVATARGNVSNRCAMIRLVRFSL